MKTDGMIDRNEKTVYSNIVYLALFEEPDRNAIF